MIGNLVGAFSTTLVGLLIDLKGYNMALTAVAVATLLITAAIYLITGGSPERGCFKRAIPTLKDGAPGGFSG